MEIAPTSGGAGMGVGVLVGGIGVGVLVGGGGVLVGGIGVGVLVGGIGVGVLVGGGGVLVGGGMGVHVDVGTIEIWPSAGYGPDAYPASRATVKTVPTRT
jgi:hypothetical protein